MRRVGVHRYGYVHVSQGRLGKRVEFPAVLAAKFSSKRKCGPEMGRGLHPILPTSQKPGWAQNSDFPADLGPRSV